MGRLSSSLEISPAFAFAIEVGKTAPGNPEGRNQGLASPSAQRGGCPPSVARRLVPAVCRLEAPVPASNVILVFVAVSSRKAVWSRKTGDGVQGACGASAAQPRPAEPASHHRVRTPARIGVGAAKRLQMKGCKGVTEGSRLTRHSAAEQAIGGDLPTEPPRQARLAKSITGQTSAKRRHLPTGLPTWPRKPGRRCGGWPARWPPPFRCCRGIS